LLLQRDQVHCCLMTKLAQGMQSPQFSNVLNTLYDGTPESTRSIPNMSVFDYPISGTTHQQQQQAPKPG